MYRIVLRLGVLGATAGVVSLVAGLANGSQGFAAVGLGLGAASVTGLVVWYRRHRNEIDDIL